MEIAEEQKKKKSKKKTASVLAAIGLVVALIQGGIKIGNFYTNKEPMHYFGDTAQYIDGLTHQEQQVLLSAFDINVPAGETEAYIRYFGKKEFSGNYTAYFVEFDDVKSFDSFYSANVHREPSINQTIGAKEDIYLIYAVRVTPAEKEEQLIAHLYEEFCD